MKTLLLAPLLLAVACAPEHHDAHVVVPSPRPVSIQVEVYDPATNFVWENVSVRVMEADQEWSGLTYSSPYTDWYLTDRDGLVYFDEYLLADATVGFPEDPSGAAMIGPRSFEDEASVWLEISADGFTAVIVEVMLTWDQPDMFVSVPFN